MLGIELGSQSYCRRNTVFQEAIGRAMESYRTEVTLGKKGCQLAFLAQRIRARYSYRLMEDESGPQKIQRLALGKVAQCLRDAGTLFNKVDTNTAEINELRQTCTLYFNLLALFFPDNVNLTVWTVGYAIPYHAELLYKHYKVGCGIISPQAKESKHSVVKEDLSLTNRSRSTTTVGKWWQLMRTNYVRAFYLPEHQPAAPSACLSL